MWLFKCIRCFWFGPDEETVKRPEKKNPVWERHVCPVCGCGTSNGGKIFKENWHALNSNDIMFPQEMFGKITHVRLKNGRVSDFKRNWRKFNSKVTHVRLADSNSTVQASVASKA